MNKIYKLSNYAIISDIVNDENDKVAFSGRTGKILIISETVYECITKGFFDKIPEDKVKKLIDAEIIVNANENELLTVVNANKNRIDNKNNNILYEVLQPSANCQLGCHYCGQQHVKANMNADLIDKICNRVEAKLIEKEFKGLYMCWFGSEPLMGLKQIRIITKRLKDFCIKNNLSYGAKMVTNGLSLKEDIFIEVAKELAVDKIEITLDGVAEYHDEHRFVKGGGKSFDLILKNLIDITSREDFFDYKCRITIRCNVDETNEEGVSKLISLLAKENIHTKISSFYPVKIFNWGGNDASSKTSTKEEFAKREMLWKLEMIENKYRDRVGLPGRRHIVCMSLNKDAELIDAYGNVFNCTEISYSKHYDNTQHVLGNIKVGDPNRKFENPPLSEWNNVLLNDTFPCHTCKILPVCGGQCPKKWYEKENACPPVKYSLREKLELYYIMNSKSLNDEQRDNRLEDFKKKILKHSFTMMPHLSSDMMN